MSTMLDSVNPFAIPPDAPIVAGYVDGLYTWSPAGWARFSGQKVSITVKGAAGARVADVESGDLTPAQAVEWCRTETEAGRRPTLYVSKSEWPEVYGPLGRAADYWVADWTGKPHLLPNTVATQYAQGGPYDTSVTDGVWPGSPAPLPPPSGTVNYPGDNMQANVVDVLIAGGKGWVPLPVNAAKVTGVELLGPNPDVIGQYPTLPTFTGLATQAGPHSPNGAAMFAGPDGTWSVLIWSVD